LEAIMKFLLGALFSFVVPLVSGCTYDNTDYSGEVRARAVAELDCDAEAIQITPIADDHGVHTFVCRGCGCVATYVCGYKDYDSCNRDPTLEPADASCR
jgi:hypothetical protein